ncbi:hypothetical protein BABINDRAFT_8421 [Babjeviella inositovora NRRL Y-12698]|uniref:Zn(2)-C6 fungal-type domain-containing protein n=1 Tax=Babjeviella inositovora NRRL Y-12698 TaxID=984486 RepID=A0A1E3QRC1_9ASCO|nr:uncharacterized protein BABINDRAFT_8421 [Babjeviella inositovora NRRL Y-12698]ODQ79497.1 hypothetical protein BABINDRAFT_8421 [Babjeviella inositovora NRRL Y-12698]
MYSELSQAEKRFHKLTCAHCRKKKERCDGAYPVCTACRVNKISKCNYDKPASIAYVRHLEKQVLTMQKKLDDKLDESITVPYEYVSRTMKHTDYFIRPFPNHLPTLLAELHGNEDAESQDEFDSDKMVMSISDKQFDEIMAAKGLTTLTRMANEAIRQLFVGVLPRKVSRCFEKMGPEDEIPDLSETYSSPLIGEVVQFYIKLFGNSSYPLGSPSHNSIQLTQDAAFRHKWVTLMSQALFEPPTQALAFAYFFQSNLEIHLGGSMTRSWIFLGISAKILARLWQYSTKATRLYWVLYVWDKMLSTLMNRLPLMAEVPPAFPDEVEFSIFDVHSVEGNSLRNLDTTPLLIVLCRMTIILGDMLHDADRFLPVRNNLLTMADKLMDSIPHELRDSANQQNLGYYNALYHTFCGIKLRLLSLQFGSSFQAQLRTLRGKNPGDAEFNYYSYSEMHTFNPAEYLEMVDTILEIRRLILPSERSKQAEEENTEEKRESFLVVRKYWLMTFIIMPMHKLLANMSFIEYTEGWANNMAMNHPQRAERIDMNLFVDFFRILWEQLASEKRYFGPAVRDCIEFMAANPLKILERDDYAYSKSRIETCLEMIKANQVFDPDASEASANPAALTEPESVKLQSTTKPKRLRQASYTNPEILTDIKQEVEMDPKGGWLTEPAEVECIESTHSDGTNSSHHQVASRYHNAPILETPHGLEQDMFAPLLFQLYYGATSSTSNSEIFAPPIQLIKNDYNDKLTMETFLFNGMLATGDQPPQISDEFLNHYIEGGSMNASQNAHYPPSGSWGVNQELFNNNLFQTPYLSHPRESLKSHKRHRPDTNHPIASGNGYGVAEVGMTSPRFMQSNDLGR